MARSNIATKPGSAPSTRDRLKANARRLFAEKGIEATTVRDILTAAGEKNGASLNYYFGSKEELIREITTDIFLLMEQRWSDGLARAEVEERDEIRDYVRILVAASDTSDVEEVPTAARLVEAVTHERFHIVMSVLKEKRLTSYDRVLDRIANKLTGVVSTTLLRQRLVFLTRYLSTVFALYETTKVGMASVSRLGAKTDFGVGNLNLIDSAVGLLTAPVVEALSDNI